MARIEQHGPGEIKQLHAIEALQEQLNQTMIEGVAKGDLAQAQAIREQIQIELDKVRQKIDPLAHAPFFKSLYEQGKAELFNLTIGDKTAKMLEREIRQHKMGISIGAVAMIYGGGFVISEKVEEVTILKVRLGDLGFNHRPFLNDIYAKALSLGLELCWPEVGLKLRTLYSHQPASEEVMIGMKPIRCRGGGEAIYYLLAGDNGGLEVHQYMNFSAVYWRDDDQFVFQLPKRAK